MQSWGVPLAVPKTRSHSPSTGTERLAASSRIQDHQQPVGIVFTDKRHDILFVIGQDGLDGAGPQGGVLVFERDRGLVERR